MHNTLTSTSLKTSVMQKRSERNACSWMAADDNFEEAIAEGRGSINPQPCRDNHIHPAPIDNQFA